MASSGDLASRVTTLTVKDGDDCAEMMVSVYDDAVLIVLTQTGAMGTILLAQRSGEESASAAEPLRIRTLMGKRDEPLQEVVASQMAETLGRRGWAGKVLVSLGMKALRQGLLKESVAVLSRLPLPGLPSGTDPTGTGD